MDLYTFGGGLSEPRASLLANKGYVVLALAYYGYQDLPKKPKMLDLEYFEEAMKYLRGHPEVNVEIKSREIFWEGFLICVIVPDIYTCVCIFTSLNCRCHLNNLSEN